MSDIAAFLIAFAVVVFMVNNPAPVTNEYYADITCVCMDGEVCSAVTTDCRCAVLTPPPQHDTNKP